MKKKKMNKRGWLTAAAWLVAGIAAVLFGGTALIGSITSIFRPQQSSPIGLYLVIGAVIFLMMQKK